MKIFLKSKLMFLVSGTFLYRVLASFLFALLTSYSAQIKVFLGWTPVPITLQTFTVLLSGIILGPVWGAMSQVIYIFFGAIGLPLFSGMSGGLSILYGPRGGYLLGFIVASFLASHVRGTKSFSKLFLMINIVGFVPIYFLGCGQLFLYMWLFKGSAPSLYSLLSMGFFPFIIGDVVKNGCVAIIARSIRKTFR